MATFHPSRSTVELALECSGWLPADLMARRGLSPALRREGWTLEDLKEEAVILTTEVLGLIAVLGRHQACRLPDSELVLVTGGEPTEVLARNLISHLKLAKRSDVTARFVRQLSGELCEWVSAEPEEAGKLHLTVSKPSTLHLQCRLPKPVLSPLNPSS